MDLHTLGWDDAWECTLRKEAGDAQALQPGRVAMEDRQSYTVVTRDGERIARVAGRFLQKSNPGHSLPKVGDWVALSQKTGDSRAVIQQVLPRRTSFTRKIPGRESTAQVLAANIDVAFIVHGLDLPIRPRRLERFLIMALEGGTRPVIVLNKADLCPDLDAALAEARLVAGTNTTLLTVSARTRRGLGELRRCLADGRTGAFVGASGVGKSSLINRLYGEAIQATLEVREQDRKGRHTTSWRELILLPGGGLVIDTPGLREFHLWVADGGLADAFPEITELAVRCHLRACSHTREPRCAVLEALQQGTLDPARFASFRKLEAELASLALQRREHTYVVHRRNRRRRDADQNDPLAWDDL